MIGVGNVRSPILNSGKFNSSAPLQVLPPLKKPPIEWEVSREKNAILTVLIFAYMIILTH
jgi:hypothetical protein